MFINCDASPNCLLIPSDDKTLSSDGNKSGILRAESNDGLAAPSAVFWPSLSLSEWFFWSADVFNPDLIFKTRETPHYLWDLDRLSSQKWMFTREQHQQTQAKHMQARLVDARESGFISCWHDVTGLWKSSLPDPVICTEAFSSATLCITMFHSLSNGVTIWNILQNADGICLTTSNFLSNAQLFITFADALLRAPLHPVSICLMDRLSYSHSAVLLPRYRRLYSWLLLALFLPFGFQPPHKYNSTVQLNHF